MNGDMSILSGLFVYETLLRLEFIEKRWNFEITNAHIGRIELTAMG